MGHVINMTHFFIFGKGQKAAPPEGGGGATFIQRLKPVGFPVAFRNVAIALTPHR
jgi:hypothetical protein